MSLLKNLYTALATAPETQLDASITNWIKLRIKKDPSDESILKDFLFIVDFSARYSLASDFVIHLLTVQLKENNIEFNEQNCPWRQMKDPDAYFGKVIQDGDFNE